VIRSDQARYPLFMHVYLTKYTDSVRDRLGTGLDLPYTYEGVQLIVRITN
jgi:hypothetical protein